MPQARVFDQVNIARYGAKSGLKFMYLQNFGRAVQKLKKNQLQIQNQTTCFTVKTRINF